jgi:hypothetical protein
MDGGEEVTIELTSGPTTPAATIAAEINTALGATVATVTTDDYIKAITEVRPTLTADMMAEFERGKADFARL